MYKGEKAFQKKYFDQCLMRPSKGKIPVKMNLKKPSMKVQNIRIKMSTVVGAFH